MLKVSKILTAGAVAAALGVAIVPAATYASTYDENTNVITAGYVNDTYGWRLDYVSGEAFMLDSSTDNLTIQGSSIDDVRNTLIALADWLIDGSAPDLSNFVAKLAGVTDLTIDIDGNAEIIPNDLGYLKYLMSEVGNSNDPTIEVNVSGTASFGPGTADYAGETIADVATAKMSLSAAKIELPYGTDPATFFGAAAYDPAAVVFTNVPAPSGDSGGAVAVATLTSPETGQASGSSSAVLVAAASALAAIGGSAVVLRKLQK
jgi:hypothetical protein